MHRFLEYKVPVMGLFFILFIQPTFSKDLQMRWDNLLYLDHKKPLISDSSFYFNQEFTSSKDLYQKLTESKNNPAKLCKYPARYLWLSNYLDEQIDFSHCSKLNDFLTRAPLDKASINFASENITSPTSMMGHIYLNIEGEDINNTTRRHSISFFINADQDFFINLFFETLITGKKGYYALAPSFQLEQNYLIKEQRNVWKFYLKLTPFQKKLLHYHLYELKDIQLTYYFHKFNCATLIDRILRVVYPTELNRNYAWVSPLDIIRELNSKNLISSQSVELASSWNVKAINQENLVSKETIKAIKDKKKVQTTKDESKNFLNYQLAKSYYLYQSSRQKLSENELEKSLDKISHLKKSFSTDTYLNLSNYKNPTQTRSYGFHSFGYDSNNNLLLETMPLSHTLSDDQSQYLNTSELKIFHTSLKINQQRVDINQLTFYSSTFLVPHDPLISSLSTHFDLKLSEKIDKDLNFNRSLELNYMLGKSFLMTRDFLIYTLLGGNSWFENELHLSPKVEQGFILNQIFQTKTIFKTRFYFTDSNMITEAKLIESKLFGKSKFNIELSHIHYRDRSINHLAAFYYFFF